MANIFERKADRGGGGTKKVVVGKGLQKQREMHLYAFLIYPSEILSSLQ
jgi:hypothetical protein